MARKRHRRWPPLFSVLTVALSATGGLIVFLNSFHNTSDVKSDMFIRQTNSGIDGKAGFPTKSRLPAEGTFNNIPISHNERYLHSTYSCVGENFRDDAWYYRSCKFRNLCFDLSNRTYVLFQSQDDQKFEQLARDNNRTHISTTKALSVSLGGINRKWRPTDLAKLEWFPRIEMDQPPGGYYELPADTTWVPFHSLAGYNAGHLMWDDFFAIFKLLQMFDLLHNNLLLTKIERKVWGSCDWNPKKTVTCNHLFQKFLPAMGLDQISTINSTNHDFNLTVGALKSNYVCAPHGAAGLGMLTDHGLKFHGWDEEDWESTVNTGRGHAFYEFQSFMLRNLGVSSPTTLGPPYNICFSRYSSSTKGRLKGFGKQVKLLKRSIQKSHNITISGSEMSKLSLYSQAEMASQAAIFVTVVGGGAMTATFLPRGATLILYYEATGGLKRDKETGKPAFLDWDVLNHASHLRVHWLPIETIDEPQDLNFFLELVKHEIEIIKQL
ncbi:DUF563-containing protein [Fragilaria crotonensis]|nr:DUF563-containing protein [Fragilaria crotonensis]